MPVYLCLFLQCDPRKVRISPPESSAYVLAPVIDASSCWQDPVNPKNLYKEQREFLVEGMKYAMDEYSTIPKKSTSGSFNTSSNARHKNRYLDVLAYDHTRVHLGNNNDGDDYINANFVTFPSKPMPFRTICSQGPRPDTVNDHWYIILIKKIYFRHAFYQSFLYCFALCTIKFIVLIVHVAEAQVDSLIDMNEYRQMIWEQRVKVIVVLTQTVEAGRQKCAQYWPTAIDQSLTTPLLEIMMVSSSADNPYDPEIFSIKLKVCTVFCFPLPLIHSP